VVVSGGFNDQKVDALPAASMDVLTRLHKGLPGVPVVVLSNFAPAGEPSAVQIRKRDIIEEAARKTGSTFIDVSRLFVGRHDLIGADNTHPTDAGHQYIADFLAPRLPNVKARK
jgi:hypothetical protein